MISVDRRSIPNEILQGSVLAHLAAAYFSVSKQLEAKTGCSQTRGFILASLRGGSELNQNQIARLLGFDRTVVHRAIGTMLKEGLVSKTKADAGRAFAIRLTSKGKQYREQLVKERRAAEEKVAETMNGKERSMLLDLLARVADLKL